MHTTLRSCQARPAKSFCRSEVQSQQVHVSPCNIMRMPGQPAMVHPFGPFPQSSPVAHTAAPWSSRLVAGSGLQGPLDSAQDLGHTRAFRRKTKNLLKKGSDTTSEQQPSSVVAAVAVTVEAPPETIEGLMSSGEYAANNIVPAGQLYCSNNLSKNRALVLDCAYRPINVITWPKAVMMDWTQKAEVVEYYPPPATAYSGQGAHLLPAVVRVPTRYVDMNEVASEVACNRRNILVRDRFTCQYCGCSGKDLTVDHILPVSKGGRNNWLNLVAACMPCNQRKGDKLLHHLGWKLRSTPKKPSAWELGLVIGLSSSDVERPCPEWAPYVEPYREKVTEIRRRAYEAGIGSENGEDD